MRSISAVFCVSLACYVGASSASAAENDAGMLAFNNHCRQCHSYKKDDNRLGPSLYGVVGRKAGSLTWAGLYNTYYWIDPATRVAGVIMMQILPCADRPALKVYREFERGICHAVRRA